MGAAPVIIVGAGLGGLSAGCYCRMNGYSTRIFERNAGPGGVAKARTRNGYTIDSGLHLLMGHRPGQAVYDLYRELGAVQVNRFLDLGACVRLVDETAWQAVTVTGDLDRLAANLKSISSLPGDARVVDDLISGARAMRRFDLGSMFSAGPPELSGFTGEFRKLWRMRRALKYLTGEYASPVTEYVRKIQDPCLRKLVANLFPSRVPVWFVLLLLGLLEQGEVGLIEGGASSFVGAIEKRYKELGGEVNYEAEVEEILVENCQAVGVRLADGSEHQAGAVISAAGGPTTVFDLLGARYLDEDMRRRYADKTPPRIFLMVCYGVARNFSGEPPLITVLFDPPFAVAGSRVGTIFVRLLNYSPAFAPPGRTLVQVVLQIEWDSWRELQTAGPVLRSIKEERIATQLLRRLEPHFPGITPQVEMTDVSAPFAAWHLTGTRRRGRWGWLPDPGGVVPPIKRTLPGLKNLYLAGQWVVPGGGAVGVLYSGRHVAQILCKRDGKRFVAIDG